MQPAELEAGATALVLGSCRDRRAFCLQHLSMAERSAAVVLPADSGGVVEAYRQAGGEAPLTVVLGGAKAADEASSDDRGVHTVNVESGTLPAIGEASLGTLETGGVHPPADRLWFAGLPGLSERASVQQVYRLLYILSKHVRKVGGVGLYTLDRSVDPKTVSILRQPLDYEITLSSESVPEIRALAERSLDA